MPDQARRVVAALALTLGAILLLVLLVVAGASVALSFPEFQRHGYSSCVSCHVQPTGGGALTAYGRAISKTALSSLPGCKCRPDLPGWTDFGLDYRYINASYFLADGTERHAKFPMQVEAEGILYPVRGFTAAASIGTYGPRQEQEFRRTYAMLTMADTFRLRGGRFTPGYGINDPDHTLWTRQALGLGQGRDQVAVEASAITRWGELLLTHAFGETFEVRSEATGTAVQKYEERKSYARLTAYTSHTTNVGVSARATDQAGDVDAYAVHGFASYRDWLYLVGDAGLVRDAGAVTYSKLGVEPTRGFHIFLTHEHLSGKNRAGVGLQWFVIQGVDLLGRARRVIEDKTDELTLVIHAYL
jgi:hypothetical protein